MYADEGAQAGSKCTTPKLAELYCQVRGKMPTSELRWFSATI